MDKIYLKETTNSNDSMFPLYSYKTNIDNKANMINCHWHDEIEFILVSSGTAVFQIESSLYEVHEGEVIILLELAKH